jgi:acyl-CoA synthetase (AMP-forming)/AMP-acid ligase II/thioesterase domain-containing protein/acyl carrier protein
VSQAAGPSSTTKGIDSSALPFVTVPDAFRAAVAQHPNRLALRDNHRSLTYREFDLASNRVANRLLELGDDRPLVVVAPIAIRSVLLMHGALKTGRLIAPLDPRWPAEQWLEIAHATNGRLVLPDAATRDRMTTLPPDAVLADDLMGDDDADPGVVADPEAPVCVFFTSGSTGAPKGTVIGHQTQLRALDMMEILPEDRYVIAAPMGFITGALSSMGIVLTGGSGHLFDITTEDISSIPSWLSAREITIMPLSVTLLGTIAGLANQEGRTIDSLRWVSHGGEPVSAQHIAECRRAFPNADFRYGYGMTETGWVTDGELSTSTEPVDGIYPAGRPTASVQIEIVDADEQPLPDGDEGEIWVTGPQVAFGYWNQPALTAERFIFHPDGRRTVRTGDRGRFRADGTLEVCGRMDRRVKVNGQLVDLALVEHEVRLLPAVRDAVVSSVPTDDGGHRVVAHVVIDRAEQATVGELRRGLAGRVPEYAMPRAFFRVEDVPQTNSGKVDRAWLRESAVGALPLETDYVAPRDDRERAVAQLFEQVLAVERVGVHDNFFELGGDSLSVVDLLAGLSDDLDLELSAGELLQGATVEEIGARLGTRHTPRARTIVRVNDGRGRPLFCVPGGGDTPVQYRPLGRRLPDIAVYAFAYRGLDSRAVPDQSVAAIARRNVAAMREIDPRGPYRILGYSFGGAVALEMAEQLVATGAEVELVALAEPSIPATAPSRVESSLAFAGRVRDRAVQANPGTDVRARIERGIEWGRAAAAYGARQLYLASAGVVRRRGLEQHEMFLHLHTRLFRAHVVEPYTGRTMLVASPQYFADTQETVDRVLPPESVGGRRHDLQVQAEHLDLMREPNVAAVARALDVLLATESP